MLRTVQECEQNCASSAIITQYSNMPQICQLALSLLQPGWSNKKRLQPVATAMQTWVSTLLLLCTATRQHLLGMRVCDAGVL